MKKHNTTVQPFFVFKQTVILHKLIIQYTQLTGIVPAYVIMACMSHEYYINFTCRVFTPF